jgi:hypothetical protein
LEQVSYGILEKCQGLSLAIITIGSLVAGKSNKNQWEQVYNSIGSAFSHQGMRDILLISYYDLPYHLKTFFLMKQEGRTPTGLLLKAEGKAKKQKAS